MNNPSEDDELRELVAAARAHDPDAWEQLYRRCRPKLLSYARRRLPSVPAAEDAVSEAFMRAISRIDDFTWSGAGFEAWMYGITRNVVHEAHRNVTRNRRLHDKQARATDPHHIGQDDVGDDLERADEHRMLGQAFAALSNADQEILELRVIGGLTADQVAEVLDRKPGAIRMAQSRALERLRNAMNEVQDA